MRTVLRAALRSAGLLDLLSVVLLSACVTHPVNPRCGGRLQPINPPAVGAPAIPPAMALPSGRQP